MNDGGDFPRVFFRLLGPPQIEVDSGQVRIPPGRQQVILAALLLEAGRIVSTDHLVDAIWDEDPPETARTQVQICVSRLRKSLAATDVALVTSPPGYLLRADRESVDVHLCDLLVSRADEEARQGRGAEAAALLRQAAGLWRGPALSGVNSPLLSPKAARLEENRTSLIESYLDLELGLGRHDRLIGEIDDLVRRHPLRERLRGQLMLALYRSGRQAEALDAYRRGRELLIEELGLEPGKELRALESAILAGDPLSPPESRVEARSPVRPAEPPAPEPPAAEPARPAAADPEPREARPRQLPADTADFVGREEWISSVETTLTRPGNQGRAVGVAVIVGRPGVGKSSLATHIAHRLADAHFPDGQLYCDMRGSRDDPLESSEVLARFLRALGIPGQTIPEHRDERAEMYRSLLSDRRVLVVLDDAAGERQVTDLLPGGSGCALVVTSRSRLTGVPGANLVELDVLPEDEALDLLHRVVGPERMAAEPAAAAALLRTVGRLPLALRIVAARLAARRHWSLASMVNRLADERHRLDELSHGDLTMRASLSLSYDGMDADTRRALRLFALADGPSQPGWIAGALLDDHRRYPSDLLEPLVDVQMLDVTGFDAGGEPRYRFHDVIRLFARERLAEEVPQADRTAAAARLVGGWLALADDANLRIRGGDHLFHHGTGPRWQPPRALAEAALRDPMGWLESEQGNLFSAVCLAADHGLDELCWNLALALVLMYNRRGYSEAWERTNERAMAAVRAADNRLGIAAMTSSYGFLYLDQRRFDDARRAMLDGLAAFEELDDVQGRAQCTRELAYLDQAEGDYESALTRCARAYRDFESIDDPVGMGRALTLSGHIHTVTGSVDAGEADLARALVLYERTGDPRSRAQVLRRMGQVAQVRGDDRGALRILTEAFELLRDLGDPIGEGYLLHDLGRANVRLGRPEEARGLLGRALAVREQIMDRQGGAQVSLDLARLLADLGETEQAAELEARAARFTPGRGDGGTVAATR
ncbi:DNA-binding transcriptional activator of the SARP family [Nocardiopsis flavescens]|uniref:DNA-binding transcriptional activator of the SARP family n=1 Tax=Nocardiopsis flavescens TaxID=758803 RepID=A0A1M6N722_9ACTN|nr:BTAD domain-containing putative transcriptional regulator [Nocardiopsis flavescens]SHJ91481.1 DNA-binding transcriptional activator of the SARP family [Nocardiopsis flavescens]